MRALVALVLLLLLGGGAFLLLQTDDEAPPPAIDQQAPDEGPEQPPLPVTGERTEGPAPRADEAPPVETASDNAADEPEQPAPEEALATVVVQVRNVIDKQAVAPFRWSFTSGGNTMRGESEQARTGLPIPRRDVGTLLIEADGMQPFSVADYQVPPSLGELPQQDVFLTPTQNATGITLLVRDLARQPIKNVRVDAFQITDDNRETTWQMSQPLWARATSSDDGNYQLPPLGTGEFGILLVATDETGTPLPLAPYRRAFVLTGSNGFVEDVTLEPACHLVLDLLEPNGQPIDPELHGRITIGLRLAGGPPYQRMWSSRSEDGKLQTAVNSLVQKGSTWPTEPLPEGNYTLEVFVNGDPRVQQNLYLRAGQTQNERVIVR